MKTRVLSNNLQSKAAKEALNAVLQSLNPIDLAGLDKVRLLSRVDTKAFMPARLLPELLDRIRDDYFVLDTANTRAATYHSLYYDTEDLQLYTLHHNRKLNRYKIRYRKYVESKLAFFEIKFKSNKGRTEKSRIRVDDIEHQFGEAALDLLKENTNLEVPKLIPKLWINFNRITLAAKNFDERITFDLGLHFKMGDSFTDYGQIVICEIKQGKFSRDSSVLSAMKQLDVHPRKLSKYCLGVVSTYNHVKKNRFKKKLRQLNKVIYEHS